MATYRLHRLHRNKLHKNNKVYNYIHNCCIHPITNNKEEAVHLVY